MCFYQKRRLPRSWDAPRDLRRYVVRMLQVGPVPYHEHVSCIFNSSPASREKSPERTPRLTGGEALCRRSEAPWLAQPIIGPTAPMFVLFDARWLRAGAMPEELCATKGAKRQRRGVWDNIYNYNSPSEKDGNEKKWDVEVTSLKSVSQTYSISNSRTDVERRRRIIAFTFSRSKISPFQIAFVHTVVPQTPWKI